MNIKVLCAPLENKYISISDVRVFSINSCLLVENVSGKLGLQLNNNVVDKKK